MKKVLCSIDIVDIKQKIISGRFATEINTVNDVLLKDTLTGEAVKIMSLPEGYCFRPRAKWEPQFIYTYDQVENYMQGHEGWACSECGFVADKKHDYCICGADMRENNKPNKELQELLDQL